MNSRTQKCSCDLLMHPAHHKTLDAVDKNDKNDLTGGVQDNKSEKGPP